MGVPSNITAAKENSEEKLHGPANDTNPHTLPFPQLYIVPPGIKATEDNVDTLKEWFLDYYGATTFNVCEYQLLPLMV